MDTNVIAADLSLRALRFKVLVEYARRMRYDIVLSALVQEELLALYERHLRDRIETAQKALKNLDALAGTDHSDAVSPIDAPASQLRFSRLLFQLFGTSETSILPYTDADMRDAVRRAVHRQPPCSEKGEEIRDAILWGQVLRLASKDVTVQFISANRREFAAQEQLKPQLQAEAARSEGVIEYYSSLEEYLRLHTERVEFVTREWLLTQLSTREIAREAHEDIERIAEFVAEDACRRNEELVSIVHLSGIEVDLKEFYLHELDSSTLVIEGLYAGEALLEADYAERRALRWTPDDDVGSDGYGSEFRSRSLFFEYTIRVQLLAKNKMVTSWVVEEVSDVR